MSADFDHLLSKLPPVTTPFKDAAEGRMAKRPNHIKMGTKYSSLPLLTMLVQAQSGICALCGRTFLALAHTPNMHASIDHVVPKSRGGKTHGNVIAAHAGCNGEKGDRLPTGCELIWLAAVNAALGVAA